MASLALMQRLRNTCWSLCSTPWTIGAGEAHSPPHLNVRRLELMLQQREDVGDDGIHVDGAGLELSWARQVQETVDDLRSPDGLSLDFLEELRVGPVRIRALEQHLSKAGNPGQGRIDLVSHAGSQDTDGRHLLGDLQLLLELHAIRRVLDQHNRPSLTVGRPQRHRRRVDEELARLGMPGHEGHTMHIVWRPVVGRCRRPDRLEEFRIEQGVERASDGLVLRDAIDALELLVPPNHAVVEVHDDQAVVQRLDHVLTELTHLLEFVRP